MAATAWGWGVSPLQTWPGSAQTPLGTGGALASFSPQGSMHSWITCTAFKFKIRPDSFPSCRAPRLQAPAICVTL
jgi:hypothetical protein